MPRHSRRRSWAACSGSAAAGVCAQPAGTVLRNCTQRNSCNCPASLVTVLGVEGGPAGLRNARSYRAWNASKSGGTQGMSQSMAGPAGSG
ncbi:MAG: hypothetical protein HOW59_40535 [Nonomuraea sp.]|nr:hypothetical protein [Nonomuraea sp.]